MGHEKICKYIFLFLYPIVKYFLHYYEVPMLERCLKHWFPHYQQDIQNSNSPSCWTRWGVSEKIQKTIKAIDALLMWFYDLMRRAYDRIYIAISSLKGRVSATPAVTQVVSSSTQILSNSSERLSEEEVSGKTHSVSYSIPTTHPSVKSTDVNISSNSQAKSPNEEMADNLKLSFQTHNVTFEIPASSPSPIRVTVGDMVSKPGKIKKKNKINEDAYFVAELSYPSAPTLNGSLVGVFDGHADGGMISSWLAENFATYFKINLDLYPDNIPKAFQETFNTLQQCQIERESANSSLGGGSVGAVGYIHYATGMLYTATLGDCELKVARAFSIFPNTFDIQFIPVSLTLGWESEEEIKRLALHDAAVAKFMKQQPPQERRYIGLAVSRAIGDTAYGEAISHECTVTAFQLKPGDRVLAGSDGVWKFMQPNTIANWMAYSAASWDGTAQKIVDHAQSFKKNNDDATMVVLNIPINTTEPEVQEN